MSALDRSPAHAASSNGTAAPRVLLTLPGIHSVNRGAEVAMETLGEELVRRGWRVTLIGSGADDARAAYRYLRSPCLSRERFRDFPKLPVFRSEYVYEEASFLPGVLRRYRPSDYDVTVTCGYPFLNWMLRARGRRADRPAHVFVTHNGDWPARNDRREFKYFGCDGLVCTSQVFYEANRERWFATLIPNGVDENVFQPGPRRRERFGLAADVPLAITVGALNESKRVLAAISCAAAVDGLHLAVVGDGPLRGRVEAEGNMRMPGRFSLHRLPPDAMPDLYRSADVLLHMSREEPFGIIYLEALATGLPIVADDNPTTRWIVQDQGTLVDARDAKAVAEGLRTTLASDDPSLQGARRDVVLRRFTYAAVADAYDAFLREVIARRAGSET